MLVAGGSPGLTGAPCLAALAAARAGAGYVTVCVPGVAVGDLRVAAARADDDRARRRAAARTARPASTALVEAASARGGALVLGPGLGRSEPRGGVRARRARRASALPIVLDADGLNPFAGEPEALAGQRRGDHAARGRARAAARPPVGARSPPRACAARARPRGARGAVVVLKGDDTIVAARRRPGRRQPRRDARRWRPRAPATSSPASSARCSRRASTRSRRRCAGVRLHALAGIRARPRARGVEGMIASDVIEALAAVRR